MSSTCLDTNSVGRLAQQGLPWPAQGSTPSNRRQRRTGNGLRGRWPSCLPAGPSGPARTRCDRFRRCLGIKSCVAHVSSPGSGVVGTRAIIAHFVCSARRIYNLRCHKSISVTITICIIYTLYIKMSVDSTTNQQYKYYCAARDVAGADRRPTAARRMIGLGAIRGTCRDSDPRPHSFARSATSSAAAPAWCARPCPSGCMAESCGDLITLRAGLSPEQELLTLVHELTHWLAHRDCATPACIAPSSNTKPKRSRPW